MDRCKDIVLHDSFADEDGVLEVITVPRHERAKYVPAQSQFPALRARPVGNYLFAFNTVALGHQNFLVDASGRIRAHEFANLINMNAAGRIMPDLALGLRQFAVRRYDHLITVDRCYFPGLFRHHHGPRPPGSVGNFTATPVAALRGRSVRDPT